MTVTVSVNQAGTTNTVSVTQKTSVIGIPTGGATGQSLVKTSGTDYDTEWSAAGSGDVTGPGSAVDENITVFDSTTGKIIKDSGTNISAVTANSAKVTNATHSGDVTGDGALTIANDAVTYEKMQNVVNDERILGRVSGANGVVEELTAAQVLTMIGAAVDDITVNVQTGTTYTIQASDNGKLVTLDNASAIAVTIPDALSAGFNCIVSQKGAGQPTFAGSGSMTISAADSAFKLRVQESSASLIVDSTNNCLIAGDTST